MHFPIALLPVIATHFAGLSQWWLLACQQPDKHSSEDFSLLVTCGVFARYFFVVFSWLFRGPLLSRKTVFGPFSLLFRGLFVAFSWFFRGPRFGQILRVLALEQSSELCVVSAERAAWKNSRSPSGIEIFKRGWKCQASHPANPYFMWRILRSRLKCSSEIEFFKLRWAKSPIANR